MAIIIDNELMTEVILGVESALVGLEGDRPADKISELGQKLLSRKEEEKDEKESD